MTTSVELVPASIEPDLEELIVDAIKAALFDLHTGLPAKVVSFDPATQSCVVQPLLKRAVLDDDEAEVVLSLPKIFNVPVVFPAFGSWSITAALLPDEIVYLAFAERSLDRWLAAPSGTEVDPLDARKHALSDAIAIPGLRPRVDPIPGISLTSLRISNADGTVAVELSPTAVNVTAPIVNINSGGAAASQHLVLGEALIAWLNTHVHPTAGPGAPSPPTVPAPPSILSATALVSP